jgi:hypothetical protein
MIICDAAATDPHDIIIIGANNTMNGGNIIFDDEKRTSYKENIYQ